MCGIIKKYLHKKYSFQVAVAKNIKQEENENLESSDKQEDKPSGPVFDELGGKVYSLF